MQTKSIFAAVICLLFTFIATAQTHNPYKDIGKKGKVLTLTNGEYDEFFDEDSIQRIGSALVNINTMKVVKLQLTKEEKRQLDNSQTSRFLSVDPLTKNFAMLTPYQYASNRPIDGIDMDGLEYMTYTVNIDLGKRTKNADGSYTIGAVTSASFVWHNAQQHNEHGPLGQGVQYIFNYYGGDQKVGQSSAFVSRNDKVPIIGFKKEYGNYMGATSLFAPSTDGPGFTKQYDYSLPAVDQVDFLAFQHDQGYDALNAVGGNSLFNDWGTTPVDEAALNGWNNLLENNPVNSKDPYNGQAVTSSERSAAWNGAVLFDFVVAGKKGDISTWMKENYKSESQNHTNKGLYGKKDLDFNYNLFLNKYMEKNEEGKWIRKSGMWSKDDKDNWTPNKPTK